jgi:hypothetical protein
MLTIGTHELGSKMGAGWGLPCIQLREAPQSIQCQHVGLLEQIDSNDSFASANVYLQLANIVCYKFTNQR